MGSPGDESDARQATRKGAYTLVLFAVMALGGLAVARALGHAHPGPVAAAAFAGVISAALLISWGAEAAEFFVSQGLAVALIALLQVLPEFMVEAVIAWKGDIANMFANATGSNRLLIGLGWPLIYFTADVSHRIRHGRGVGDVRLRRENIIEVLSLVAASSWYLKLLAFGTLTLFDGVFLIGLYVTYMWLLSRLPPEEDDEDEELLAPSRALVEMKSARRRNLAFAGVFLAGGCVMAFVADPFVESLKVVAVGVGVSEFAFIQWVAPFLSEFPEKVTAFYWSRTIRLAPMAMLNMISSVVSQYLLLVGMIPMAYAASSLFGPVSQGQEVHRALFGLPAVPMTTPLHDLRPEVFLSWAITLLGCSMLAKLRLTRADASLLLVLWLAQFLNDPISDAAGLAPTVLRWAEGGLCIAIAAAQLLKNRRDIHIPSAVRETIDLVRTRRRAAEA